MFKLVNNKYKDFVSSGHLMSLSDFVLLPEAAREKIRGLAAGLVREIKLADEKLIQFKLRAELPITKADKNEIKFFEDNVSPHIFELDILASDNPELMLELSKIFEGID